MAGLKDVLHELVDHAVTLFDRRTVLHEEIDNLDNTVTGNSDSTPAAPPAPEPLSAEEVAQLEALQARKTATEPAPVPVVTPAPEVPEEVKTDGTV